MTGYVDNSSKAKLVLPFAVSANKEGEAFSEDMEMAAILYLAESSRQKGEGYILKKPDEKLVFLTEACYPLWLVPWNGGTLLFDGLGVAAHRLSYDVLPDITVFNKDIKESARKWETYSAALSRNANYFKNFAGTEEKNLENLITFPDFTEDFSAYFSEAEKKEKPSIAMAVLSSIVNEPEISASIEELANLKARIIEDSKNVDAAMKLLSKTTREKTKVAREEIRATRKKFDKQIELAKPRIARKIRRIQGKYSAKIARISNRFGRQLQHLHKNHFRFIRIRKRLKAEMNQCKSKAKSSQRRKNKRRAIQWTGRLDRARTKVPGIERSIKDTEEKIEKLKNAKNMEISQQRINCEARIDEIMKVIRDLEASRQACISMKRQEVSTLKDGTAIILSQMNDMAISKRVALKELERICVKIKKESPTLVHLPFYFARYEMEGKNRYAIYPPCFVGDLGILTRMKGALGAARMKAFLQPRSKAIASFLNQLLTLMQENPMFEKEVTDAGIQDSILRVKELRIGVKRGLKELEDEKWMSKDELQNLSKLLYIYAE